MNSYIQNISNTFQTHNVFFFVTIVFFFQLVSTFLKPYSIDIYGTSSIMSIYTFINTPLSIYELIMGGIVATSVSYFVYILLTSLTKKINILVLHILTFTSVLITMVLLNCLSMTAIAYTLMSSECISQNKFNYLSSYIISTIIILLLCILLLFTIKTFNTYIMKMNVNYYNYKQLEKNISNTTN